MKLYRFFTEYVDSRAGKVFPVLEYKETPSLQELKAIKIGQVIKGRLENREGDTIGVFAAHCVKTPTERETWVEGKSPNVVVGESYEAVFKFLQDQTFFYDEIKGRAFGSQFPFGIQEISVIGAPKGVEKIELEALKTMAKEATKNDPPVFIENLRTWQR